MSIAASIEDCPPRLALLHTCHLLAMKPAPAKVDMHSEEFLRRLMRQQLQLSLSCTATFLLALLGLPLLNFLFPEWMAREILGFSLTWLVLGILFFPFVWLIAWIFIRR